MSDDPNITVPEASPLRRRLLNIASIACLVLCVALMGMWIRSYYRLDGLGGLIFPNQSLGVNSTQGRLKFVQEPWGTRKGSPWFLFRIEYPHPVRPVGWQRPFGLRMFPDSRTNLMFEAKYWFLVLISGSLAMIFRLRRPLRFCLRSLFIATMFLAVVLGMMTWLDKYWWVGMWR